MEFCIFISNARLDYFNLEKVVKDLNRPVCFMLIHASYASHRISEKFRAHMHKVWPLDCISFDACKEILEPLIFQGFKISLVCTDETLLVTVAQLREYFGVSGAKPHQYVPFISKISMKQMVLAGGVRVPRFLHLDTVLLEKNLKECHERMFAFFEGAYIVKPVDGGACELTAKIMSEEDLLQWTQTSYDPKLSYDVEEFIQGDFYHADSFVVAKDVKFLGVSKYLSPCLDFLSGKTLGSYLIKRNTPLYDDIVAFNKKVVEALEPPDGAIHLEFFVKNNELIFIEIGSRPPGKAVCLFYEKNYNINLYELTLRHELGMPLNLNSNEDLYWAWVAFSTFPGTIMELNPPLLKSKINLDWKVSVGDEIHKYPKSINEGISAESFVYNENYEELMEDMIKLKDHRMYFCQ